MNDFVQFILNIIGRKSGKYMKKSQCDLLNKLQDLESCLEEMKHSDMDEEKKKEVNQRMMALAEESDSITKEDKEIQQMLKRSDDFYSDLISRHTHTQSYINATIEIIQEDIRTLKL